MSPSKTLCQADLMQFIGTECYYRHPLFSRYVYTDGVQYVAETGGAYWLIEAVFSWQTEPKVKNQEFQLWVLTVDEATQSAVLTASNGNRKQMVRQEIEFTDFPLPEIKLYLHHNVLMLTSEY